MQDDLRHIQVTSLATNIPGPVAAARLRDLGATIVKVEPPAGDALALASPDWYADLHRGLQVRRLDLKTGAGQEQIHQYLQQSDLLFTASRPASLGRLGMDWSSLAGRYPNLCQVAISGYAPPEAGRPGHDLTFQAGLGLVKPPDLPLTLVADMAAAEQVVSAALVLIYRRHRAREEGRVLAQDQRIIWVPIAEAAQAFAEPLRRGLTVQGSILGGSLPVYNVYRSADGWIAIAALERHFLAALVQDLKIKQVTKDSLAEIFLQRSSAEWKEWAVQQDFPLAALP